MAEKRVLCCDWSRESWEERAIAHWCAVNLVSARLLERRDFAEPINIGWIRQASIFLILAADPCASLLQFLLAAAIAVSTKI